MGAIRGPGETPARSICTFLGVLRDSGDRGAISWGTGEYPCQQGAARHELAKQSRPWGDFDLDQKKNLDKTVFMALLWQGYFI